MIEELLKKNNLKVTKQRKEIIKTVIDLKDNATLKNILIEINLKMDQSTAYRIIDLLVKNSILEKQINSDNEEYYMIMNEHMHYIRCMKCKRVDVLKVCPFDDININGYKIISHSVILKGICKHCQNNVANL